MGYRYILQSDVELRCPPQKVCSNPSGNRLPLGDEFGSIELGDNGFEDFIADRRKNTFIVIKSE